MPPQVANQQVFPRQLSDSSISPSRDFLSTLHRPRSTKLNPPGGSSEQEAIELAGKSPYFFACEKPYLMMIAEMIYSLIWLESKAVVGFANPVFVTPKEIPVCLAAQIRRLTHVSSIIQAPLPCISSGAQHTGPLELYRPEAMNRSCCAGPACRFLSSPFFSGHQA